MQEINKEICTDLLNFVGNHLLNQNAKSIKESNGPDKSCLLRDNKGNKCAFGCLIKDEHYYPELEHDGPDSNAVLEAIGESYSEWANLPDDAFYLMHDLLQVHDETDEDCWEENILNTGRNNGITFTRSKE